jgi:RNA recognition motif-containing protein
LQSFDFPIFWIANVQVEGNAIDAAWSDESYFFYKFNLKDGNDSRIFLRNFNTKEDISFSVYDSTELKLIPSRLESCCIGVVSVDTSRIHLFNKRFDKGYVFAYSNKKDLTFVTFIDQDHNQLAVC